MALKVVVTGASGLLGRAVFKELTGNEAFNVIGLGFSRASPAMERLDLMQDEEVTKFVSAKKPDVIVHCAANRRPDVVETMPEQTHALNVRATETLCSAAAAHGSYVLFISTDYVFDGKNPPYQVEDQPRPLNKYGQSKLEGEQVVLRTSPNNLVLRVPILYGNVESLDESAVTVLFKTVLDDSKEHVMSHYEVRYPTLTSDVARVIAQLLVKKKEDQNVAGIFHFSGSDRMTKYDMCVEMAKMFSLPHEHIKSDPTPTTGAARPHNAHLSSQRLEKLNIYKSTPFKEGVSPCLKQFYK